MPDSARRFFVKCAQIYEAYLDGTLIKFACIWRKISCKSRYKRDSDSTFIYIIETSLFCVKNKVRSQICWVFQLTHFILHAQKRYKLKIPLRTGEVFLLILRDNLFLVVASAIHADSVRSHQLTAFAALYQSGSRHFPVCSSFISSCLGRFIFWTDRHGHTSLNLL